MPEERASAGLPGSLSFMVENDMLEDGDDTLAPPRSIGSEPVVRLAVNSRGK
jgi:hypothetical protein